MNGAVSKTVKPRKGFRGFESLPLRHDLSPERPFGAFSLPQTDGAAAAAAATAPDRTTSGNLPAYCTGRTPVSAHTTNSWNAPAICAFVKFVWPYESGMRCSNSAEFPAFATSSA